MSVLIVGAGVTGQVIATRLRRDGHEVTVFDRCEPEAGSHASGGHLKPSWLGHISKPDLESSLLLLALAYGIETISCNYSHKVVELLRVDIDAVLRGGPVVVANVKQVGDGWLEASCDNFQRCFGTVIVAAGVWSGELIPSIQPELTGKKGISWVIHGAEPMENIIVPWAPYKQIVRTTHGPGRIWIGDGIAIKPENWSLERERQVAKRVVPYFPSDYERLDVHRGIRPYMMDGCRRIADKLWVATGGAKSGMALAGVYANRIAQVLA